MITTSRHWCALCFGWVYHTTELHEEMKRRVTEHNEEETP